MVTVTPIATPVAALLMVILVWSLILYGDSAQDVGSVSRYERDRLFTHRIACICIPPRVLRSRSACRVVLWRPLKISCSWDVCGACTLASRHMRVSTSHRAHAKDSQRTGGRGSGSDGGWFKRRTEIIMP